MKKATDIRNAQLPTSLPGSVAKVSPVPGKGKAGLLVLCSLCAVRTLLQPQGSVWLEGQW